MWNVTQFHALFAQVVACSVDSHFSHLAWTKMPRTEGGLGPMNIPLLSDLTHDIGKAFNVYLEKEGVTLRGLFIVDPKGVLR
jgi:peroxiredoxin (alkyl hydroperoxide reductase subunit C)